MKNIAIWLKNLWVDLEEFKLKDISLEIADGEYFMVLGPTGAGKTILLETIAGIYELKQGEIYIKGRNATQAPPENRNIGFVYQEYALFPHLNVYNNVQFGLKARKMNQPKEKTKEIMQLLDISHLGSRYPHTLSGGEKQKAALARAIVVEPEVLLLDEPLAALDQKTRDYLRGELSKINNELGITMMHVTHDQPEAMMLGHRTCVMMDGRILQIGKTDEVFNWPINEEVADFVGVENILSGKIHSSNNGVITVKVDDYKIISVSDRKNGQVKVFIRPEDITLSLKKQDSSARNMIPGTVQKVTRLGAIYRIELDNGLSSYVTKQSVENLQLKPGREVYASFKATSVKVRPS